MPHRLQTLGYTRLGNPQGQALAIIHGWGCDSRFLMPLAKMFLNYDVYLIDLPGYGKSAHLANVCANFPLSCIYLLNTIPNKAHIMSWSFGTLYALNLIALLSTTCVNLNAILHAEINSDKLNIDLNHKQHKKISILQTILANQKKYQLDNKFKTLDYVSSLITICGSPRFPSDPNWEGLSAVRILKCNTDLAPRHLKMVLNIFYRLHMAEIKKNPQEAEYLTKIIQEAKPIANEVLMAGIRLVSYLDTRPVLSHLNIPSLHIFGAEDKLVPQSIAKFMLKPPLRKVYIMPHSFHTPYLSEPKLFKQVVDNFYQELVHNQ